MKERKGGREMEEEEREKDEEGWKKVPHLSFMKE